MQKDLFADQGNSYVFPFRFFRGGAPADLTGADLVFRVVWLDGLIRKSTRSRIPDLVVTDPAGGRVEVTLTRDEVALLPPVAAYSLRAPGAAALITGRIIVSGTAPRTVQAMPPRKAGAACRPLLI